MTEIAAWCTIEKYVKDIVYVCANEDKIALLRAMKVN